MNPSLPSGLRVSRQSVHGASRSIFLFLVSGLWILVSSSTQAILDTNTNGMSDLWEKQFNNDQLFPATTRYQLAADPDSDGWNNEKEAEAGTDPFNPNRSDGFVIPDIIQEQAPGAFTLTWPSIPGKAYQLQASESLMQGSWLDCGDALLGNGNPIIKLLENSTPNSNTPPKLFYRVAINDIDQDEDGLTDAEEHQLGTHPELPDSDADGIFDHAEMLAGLYPNNPDSDLDGILDGVDSTPLVNNAIADPDGAGLDPSFETNLIGRWDFEKSVSNSNDTLLQSSTPATVGAFDISGTSTSWDGRQGGIHESTGMPWFAVQFSQVGAFGKLPGTIFHNKNTETWSMWLKFPTAALDSSNGTRTLFSMGKYKSATDDLGQPFLHAYFNGLSDTFNLDTYWISGNNYNRTSLAIWPTPASLDDGKFHHFAVTFRPGSNYGYYELYYDGVLVSELYSNKLPSLNLSQTGSEPYAYIGRKRTLATANEETLGATIDRLRIYQTRLTAASVFALYNQDIDRDELWDITEHQTRYSDYASSVIYHPVPGAPNAPQPSQMGYARSPFLYSSANLDFDQDELNDLAEQSTGTNLAKPDTDDDNLLDGFEIVNNFNPLNAYTSGTAGPRDDLSDPDSDLLSTFTEYLNDSNPRNANSDGDSKSDSAEISQGSDPANAADSGAAPADPPEMVPFHLTGDYTAWEATLKGKGPNDTRTRRFQMSAHNVPINPSIPLLRGNAYELSLRYIRTKPGESVPWYCWETTIDGKNTSAFKLADHWVVDNNSGLLATHTHSHGTNLVADKKVDILPVEFITKSGQDPDTAMSVEGVGLSNQAPQVELNTVEIGQVSIVGDAATVPITGIIRDAFMDNVAPGKGADIIEATVFVNGEEDRVINLIRQPDGDATLWRNYPAKITIPSINITVPASGIASIRVETGVNAAGIKGSDEIIVEFTEHRVPGPRVGGYTREYFLTFAGETSATVADTLTLRVGSETTTHTLTETGPNTLLFKSPAPVSGVPPTRQFVVQILSPYSQAAQVETIHCHLTDSEFVGGFFTSAQPHSACTETAAESGVFRFFETEPGIIGSYTVTQSVTSVSKPPATSPLGNHPFSFRVGAGIADSSTKLKLGSQTFDTVTLGGFTYPKLDEARQTNAYIIWNETLEDPRKELLFYDATEAILKRLPITDENTDLKMAMVMGSQSTDLLTLKSGSLTFVGADGQQIEEINRVSVQTLVDLINGDDTVVIEDDSWEKIRVRPLAKPEDMLVRIKSSEIEDDYFELKLNPAPAGKEAALVEVADNEFESALKIVVYYSAEGIETLTDTQWLALKNLGYLAVHNLSEEALEIIKNEALDEMPGNAIQEHHIFGWFREPASARYREFYSKVFAPGEFDIHDYCVPVAQKRHSRFTNAWTASWKTFMDANMDAAGNLLPGKASEQLKREVLEHAWHPETGLCKLYSVSPHKVIRYHKFRTGPPVSTLDKLLKIDSFDGVPNLHIAGEVKSIRWKNLMTKAGKKGLTALKKFKYVGIAIAAWQLGTNGPRAAAAEALGVTPSGVDAMLEGKGAIGLVSWDPVGSVVTAQLKSGKVIREGDAYYWARKGPNGLVGQVDHGEIDYIMPTEEVGVVDIIVRFGQEERTYTKISEWREGIPEEGKLPPPGWD